MFDPQHLVDLQESSGLIGDPNSWLLSDHHDNDNNKNSSPTHHHGLTQPNSTSTIAHTNGSLDRVLYKDLVEIVPLVQSLIERKTSSSFTRRGSIIYTKAPARESLYKKVSDPKGRNAAQSVPAKKKRDLGDKEQGKNNQDGGDFSIFSSRVLASENREELVALREQLEDLQRKLAEKDELLKSAEISQNQMNDVHAKLDELKRQAVEKDSLIKSTHLQLSDAKTKLADKQAALEKLQWEAMTSNSKVKKLEGELHSMQGEISSFMQLFEGLTKNDSAIYSEDYDVRPYQPEGLSYIDELDDVETQKMDEAKEAYIAALAAAKEMQDEESLRAAVRARLHLQSIVFRPKSMNSGNGLSRVGISQSSF